MQQSADLLYARFARSIAIGRSWCSTLSRWP